MKRAADAAFLLDISLEKVLPYWTLSVDGVRKDRKYLKGKQEKRTLDCVLFNDQYLKNTSAIWLSSNFISFIIVRQNARFSSLPNEEYFVRISSFNNSFR